MRRRARMRVDERGSILPLVLALILVMSIVGVAVLQQESSAPSAQSAYGAVRTGESGADSAVDGLVQSITNNPGWFSQTNPGCADASQYGSVGTYSPDGGATNLTVMCKAQSPPPQTISHDLNSYALYAQNYIRINGCNGACTGSIVGNIGVNTDDNPGFHHALNMCANHPLILLAYNSQVVASTIIGDGNQCKVHNTIAFTQAGQPTGSNWTGATLPTLRPLPHGSPFIADFPHGGACTFILPWPGDNACPLPAGETPVDIGSMSTTPFPHRATPSLPYPSNCAGSDTQGAAPLTHGTYRNLTVPSNVPVTLRGGGIFEFCKISFDSKNSVLNIDPGTGGRTYVLVHGTVDFNGGDVLDASGRDDTLFFVRGEGTQGTSGSSSANPNSLNFGNVNAGEVHGIFLVGGDTSCDFDGDQTCQGTGTVAMQGTTAIYGHVYGRVILDGGGADIYAASDRVVDVSVCAPPHTGAVTTPECTTSPSLLHALVRLTGADPLHPSVTVLSWTRNPSS